MKVILYITAITLLLPCRSKAQEFWSKNQAYPGEPTTGVSVMNGTAMIVSSEDKVWISKNRGVTWQILFQGSGISCLHGNDAGMIIAGGNGKIHTSADFGNSWTTATVDAQQTIQEVVSATDGNLFAIGVTGDINSPPAGSVYRSGDTGKTWQPVLTGSGVISHYDHLAIDRHNRVYVTAVSDDASGAGGLYVSGSGGQQWSQVPIIIDDNTVISNTITVTSSNGLSIGRDDSVMLSLNGIAVNVFVRLNVKKNINDLWNGNHWAVRPVTASWWADKAMHDVYTSQNGDLYSCAEGIFSTGGTFFAASPKRQWQLHRTGLSHNQFFKKQFFAEDRHGVVYMVHARDNYLYHATRSIISGAGENDFPAMLPHPNPLKAGSALFVGRQFNNKELFVSDLSGSEVIKITAENDRVTIPLAPGTYFLWCRQPHRLIGKIVVINH